MQISVTDQLPALSHNITALQRRLNGDLTPLMRAIGAVVESSTRQRFASKQSPDGVAWTQLKPSTVRQKQKASGRSAGILVDRGDLMKSITHQASRQSVAIGTNRHYAKYHQTGTSKMPARAFLGLPTADKQGIRGVVNDFLSGAINNG